MVKACRKGSDGVYTVNGKKFDELFGSRAQVYHGTACKTTGGLKKSGLFKNKNGRIVSAKKHKTAKKEKRLKKYGYGYTKGKFGVVKLAGTHKRSSKKRGSKGRGSKGRSRRSRR